MKGKLWVINPGEAAPTGRDYAGDDMELLAGLQEAVGGYFEVVPYFFSFRVAGGDPLRCFAFCDEHGKQKGLAHNAGAQALWQAAMDAFFAEATGGQPVANHDRLVGPVAIVTGDDEFLAQL